MDMRKRKSKNRKSKDRKSKEEGKENRMWWPSWWPIGSPS